jgi:hypothetical protein
MSHFESISLQIQQYSVLLTYPISASVSYQINGNRTTLSLAEPGIPQDPTSNLPDKFIPFNGYSGNGAVSGELIYCK